MVNRKPLTDEEGEVRELTAKDFHHFQPAKALSPSLAHKLGVRGPQKSPTKERITIRISRDVLEVFRATGSGWQSRVDDVLKDWVATHVSSGRQIVP
ncbi:MAG: phage associated protein [Magnetococcales bacterium]|nr:phage associated protein [Magnetococcales bacterium]HIJ85644.1 BrnA antitoxin family protein [Magnetococcales bacterium]